MASAINQTFRAFHQATRAGFTLGEVSRAPLAKRRRHKRKHSPLPPAPPHQHVRPSNLDLLNDVR